MFTGGSIDDIHFLLCEPNFVQRADRFAVNIVLSRLDPVRVYKILDNSMLLCWESPEKFCHRHLVAQWLEEATGNKVTEFDRKVPASREIHEMMNALRDRMPEDYKPVMANLETEAERIVFDAEYFTRSVELAGGWPHIHLVSKEYRDSDSRMWSVVMDHVKFVGNSASRHASKLGYVAVRYGLSPNTVMKYRRKFSVKLAKMLLMPPGDSDDFYLLPG